MICGFSWVSWRKLESHTFLQNPSGENYSLHLNPVVISSSADKKIHILAVTDPERRTIVRS
jgi:hypothetical protein